MIEDPSSNGGLARDPPRGLFSADRRPPRTCLIRFNVFWTAPSICPTKKAEFCLGESRKEKASRIAVAIAKQTTCRVCPMEDRHEGPSRGRRGRIEKHLAVFRFPFLKNAARLLLRLSKAAVRDGGRRRGGLSPRRHFCFFLTGKRERQQGRTVRSSKSPRRKRRGPDRIA